ncbi:MAG TPA: hypothetical protein VEA69_22790 [Tepidisphaeraceae bacterium]|nr:hypothetical protein [Tepidisphaeraceae bacterium]
MVGLGADGRGGGARLRSTDSERGVGGAGDLAERDDGGGGGGGGGGVCGIHRDRPEVVERGGVAELAEGVDDADAEVAGGGVERGAEGGGGVGGGEGQAAEREAGDVGEVFVLEEGFEGGDGGVGADDQELAAGELLRVARGGGRDEELEDRLLGGLAVGGAGAGGEDDLFLGLAHQLVGRGGLGVGAGVAEGGDVLQKGFELGGGEGGEGFGGRGIGGEGGRGAGDDGGEEGGAGEVAEGHGEFRDGSGGVRRPVLSPLRGF